MLEPPLTYLCSAVLHNGVAMCAHKFRHTRPSTWSLFYGGPFTVCFLSNYNLYFGSPLCVTNKNRYTYLSLIEDRKIERLKNDFIARGERKKSCVKWWLKATKYYESLYVTLIHVVNQIWIPNMVIRTCIQNNFNAGYFLRNWLTMNLLSTTKVIFLSP